MSTFTSSQLAELKKLLKEARPSKKAIHQAVRQVLAEEGGVAALRGIAHKRAAEEVNSILQHAGLRRMVIDEIKAATASGRYGASFDGWVREEIKRVVEEEVRKRITITVAPLPEWE